MTLEIQLKRSGVKDSAPTASQLKDGELGVNYNKDSLALYVKDTDGVIRKIAGEDIGGAVDSVNGQTGTVVLNATDVGALAPGDNISELNNNAGYITAADIPPGSVISVNGQTGIVVLDAADVGALAAGDNISELNNDVGFITAADVPATGVTSVNGDTGPAVTLTAGDVGAATTAQGVKADSAIQPGDDVSELNNDAGYITAGDVPAAPVTSVNSKTGAVELDLDDINDVNVGGAVSGYVLSYNGSNWVASVGPPADISGSSINQLNDVDASSATNGQIMVWNGSNWVPGDQAGGAVDSVNGQTGTVVLDAADVGAATAAQGATADTALQPGDDVSDLTNDAGYITAAEVPAQVNADWNANSGAAEILNKPDLSLKADLVDGKVPTSQIPAIAISEFLGDVASEAEMLALSGEKGDWCIRNDVDNTYVITGDNPSLPGSWTALVTPESPVTSVNGQVGTVVLSAADVGAATAAQGAKADTAVQPGANVSIFNNDSGYITAADAPVNTLQEVTDAGNTTTNDIKIGGTSSAPNIELKNSGKGTFAGQVSINKPSDFWASEPTFIGISDYGCLATQGAYGIALTSNGYRNSDGKWTSLGVNGGTYTGAAQVQLLPDGKIEFNTDATKSTGDSYAVPTRMVIANTGDVGIATSNPQARLDVNGGITAAGTIKAAGSTGGVDAITAGTASGSKFFVVRGNGTVLGNSNGSASVDDYKYRLDADGTASFAGDGTFGGDLIIEGGVNNQGAKISRDGATGGAVYSNVTGNTKIVALDNGEVHLDSGGTTALKCNADSTVDILSDLVVSGGINATGKVTSASTVASDPDNTLVTKDYVDDNSGGILTAGLFDQDGLMLWGNNIASIARLSKGQYQVTFTEALASTEYVVTASATTAYTSNSSPGPGTCTYDKTTTGFKISSYSSGGQKDQGLQFAVIGPEEPAITSALASPADSGGGGNSISTWGYIDGANQTVLAAIQELQSKVQTLEAGIGAS